MHKLRIVWLAAFFVAAFVLAACDSQDSQSLNTPESTADPETLDVGKFLFVKNCAICHGRGGKGTNQGPPLVHRIYEPNHHADFSFYRAVASGVRAHHWNFGNMAPVPGVSPEDVGHIIAYIRQEQRQAGIH